MAGAQSRQPEVRILAVDDEEEWLREWQRMLSRKGYAVETARTGRDALRLLEQERFDIILLDLLMPEIGGIEVLRRTRPGAGPEPPPDVVVVTGNATVDRTVEAMRLGAYGVIEKTKPEAVLAAVDELVRLRTDEIVAYIRAHPGEVGSRDEVAARFRISPRAVYDRVERLTG